MLYLDKTGSTTEDAGTLGRHRLVLARHGPAWALVFLLAHLLLLLWPWSSKAFTCVSSCEEPGGPSERRPARTGDTGKAGVRCAS